MILFGSTFRIRSTFFKKFKPIPFIFNRYMMASTNNCKCAVAVCQLTATNNKQENFKIVERLVIKSAENNAKIVFLPEACDYIGTSREESKELAETLDGPLMSQYKFLAKKYKIWLSIGGFHEKSVSDNNEEKLHNAHIIIDSDGNIRSIYRKLHLFDVDIPERNIKLKESDDVFKGKEIVPLVDTPAGPLGLSICYDIRFPELAIILRKKGAHMLTYPSAFTSGTGLAHWEVLLRARAIENQCYVIAAAQYGKHNSKRTSHGQAMIVDPWGQVVAECPKYSEDAPTNESFAIATIDVNFIEKVRKDIPVFQNRREDMYQLISVDNTKIPDIDSVDFYMFSDKKIPSSTVFYRTKHIFAFTNIRCVVPGHVLVSTLRFAKRLLDLTAEEIADMFQAVVRIQKVLEKVHGAPSSTICIQDGPEAGQTVPHVHCHILPRKKNDCTPSDSVYEKLAVHDKEGMEQPLRKLEEQIEEAQMLRKYF